KDESEVCERFRKLSVGEWLQLAGDKTWESICEGYLIFEKDFLPTGLRIGGTLADLDIVGSTRGGVTILAQCKKHPTALSAEDGFISFWGDFPDPKESYYFAFGGVLNPPTGLRVVDGQFIENWLETTENGRLYQKLLGLA